MAVTGVATQIRASIFVERITIRNCKGIEHLDVELRPGLSSLVGRNNAGKSRILLVRLTNMLKEHLGAGPGNEAST